MDNIRTQFSIILPCYNITPYLVSCLDSIYANDIDGCEIILVDDGSKDDFRRCAQTYFNQSLDSDTNRFSFRGTDVVVVFKQNGGVSSARNRGIHESSREYLLFVDPDDTLAKDWISTLREHLHNHPADICLFGFNTVYATADANPSESYETMPCDAYQLNSNPETIHSLFPRFIGKSLEQTKNWAKTGKFTPESEFGSAWHAAYRRSMIIDNKIRFNESIALNEDSMFNAWCCTCATGATAIFSCLYYYTVRSDGAMTRILHDGTKLIGNKTALLHERRKILNHLYAKDGIDRTELIYGSVVFSVLELMSKINKQNYNDLKENYLRDPYVKKIIKKMPFIGKIIFDIPLLFMKLGLYRMLFACMRLATKLGYSPY